MTACGMSQKQVARQLGNGGISENTLVKYFREELDTAVDKANAKIGGTAFNKALAGDAQMIRYWMNCRAGWKEKSEVDMNLAGELTITIKDPTNRGEH